MTITWHQVFLQRSISATPLSWKVGASIYIANCQLAQPLNEFRLGALVMPRVISAGTSPLPSPSPWNNASSYILSPKVRLSEGFADLTTFKNKMPKRPEPKKIVSPGCVPVPHPHPLHSSLAVLPEACFPILTKVKVSGKDKIRKSR